MSLRKGNQKGYLLDSNGKVDPFAVNNYQLICGKESFVFQNFIFIALFLICLIFACCLIYTAVGWIGLIIAIVMTLWLVFRI
jgi:uncharacterized membrane protein